MVSSFPSGRKTGSTVLAMNSYGDGSESYACSDDEVLDKVNGSNCSVRAASPTIRINRNKGSLRHGLPKEYRMDRYLVRFTALSTLQVPGHTGFNLGPILVMVTDDTEYEYHSTPWVNRLAVFVTLTAESMGKAIGQAKYAAESVVGLLVTSTSASIDLCNFDRAIEINEGTHNRVMMQVLSLPFNTPSARVFSPETFGQFHEAISNRDNQALVENEHRITRAARWYRKGILEQELFDQYQNFWTALEALKIVLNRKYEIPNDYRTEHPCEHCGKGRMVPTEGGILKLIERAGYRPELWPRLRKVRNEISHGFEPLDKIAKKAQEMTPVLQRLVLFGLLEVLDIPDDEMSKFLRDPNFFVGSPIMRVEVLLKSVPHGEITADVMPRLQCIGVRHEISSERETQATGALKLVFPSYDRGFTLLRAETEGPQDPEKPLTLNSEVTVITPEIPCPTESAEDSASVSDE